MVILFHGEDIVASRNALNGEKKKPYGETITFNGKTVAFNELQQAVESLSLFSGQRLIIIEDLHSRVSKKELQKLSDYLINAKTTADLVLWEGKEITKVSLKKFPVSWKIQLFSIPKVLFNFLETILPQNNQKMLKLLKEVRKTNNDEFIFLMMVRQFRLLILAKEKALKAMPPWMQGKLFRQAGGFSREQLLNLYRKLLVIDIGQKTGSSSFILARELDLLLATL